MNILFVCTGNTCRSPMAAALLNKKAQDNNLNLHAKSCGLSVLEGSQASENAVKAMAEIGMDISFHKAKTITEKDIIEADIVLTMTDIHKNTVLNYFGKYKDKIYTVYEYSDKSPGDIADPYGQNLDIYKLSRDELDKLLEKIIKKSKTID